MVDGVQYCRGNYNVSGETEVEMIQSFISQLDVKNTYTSFNATLSGKGYRIFIGYVYPNKEYGGGLFIASNTIIAWRRYSSVDTTNTLF